MNFLRSIRRSLLSLLARHLEFYLYHTPHIHGDKTRLVIGNNVGLNNTLFNLRGGWITVEDNVTFGHNVMVLTGTKEYRSPGKRQTKLDAQNLVVIGKNAWIASGAIIIGPVQVGKDAVVGAGAVVVKDVPDGALAVGNPAREVEREEFSAVGQQKTA